MRGRKLSRINADQGAATDRESSEGADSAIFSECVRITVIVARCVREKIRGLSISDEPSLELSHEHFGRKCKASAIARAQT